MASPSKSNGSSTGLDKSMSISEWKEKGNAAFANKDFQSAVELYQKGIRLALSASKGKEQDVLIHLYSNKAMALIKQENYEQAEEECSQVIDHMNIQDNPKVFYRRCLARIGKGPTLATQQKAIQCLEKAKIDLHKSMKAIDSLDTDKEKLNMKKSILLAAKDLQQQINTIENTKRYVPKSSETRNIPSLEKQLGDVLQLLEARRRAIPGAKPGIDGEAFFLIDWDWWADWFLWVCQGDSQLQAQILQFLTPGAIMPENEHDASPQEPPGIIDNSDLALFPDPRAKSAMIDHCRQWYWRYHLHDEHFTVLRPGLVRGYDYEILPREVYSALVAWYGEVSPSLCRRAVAVQGRVTLPLYPLRTDAVASASEPKSKCSTCQTPFVSQRCVRCLRVYYCDRACQQRHWTMHRHECKMLASDKELEPLPLVSRVGLNQLGNTCFMNSSLQCLSHVTPLTRYFLSTKFEKELNTDNPLGTGGSLTKAYDNVLQELWLKKNKSTSPTALKRAIAMYAPRFAGYLQHDAQEFLAYFLDGLHEDLNRIRHKPYIAMPDIEEGENMSIASARAWDSLRRRDDSFIMDNFYGQFKSTCVCPKCQRTSVSFDAFNHVSLSVPQVDAVRPAISPTDIANSELSEKINGEIYGVDLDACFRVFTSPERLDENNMWYCSKCKEHVRAMKTMELWRIPNILIIHLKRFEYRHGFRRDKLDTLVEFPLNGLDMSSYQASYDKTSFVDESVEATFDCFAVANHFGRMGFGHYTAFARQFDEKGSFGEWTLFDDSRVRSVDDAEVVSPAAYVLFYRRRVFH